MRKRFSTDKRPRKSRSDVGKKRTTYAGQPCKHKSQKQYRNPKGNKTEIKIFIKRIETMSEDGRKRWSPKRRNKISHEVWKPLQGQSYYVDVNLINNQEKLGNFIADKYYPGTFAVCTYSNKKTKNGYGTNKARVIVVVAEQNGHNYVKSFRNYKNRGMYTYWFWNK